MVEVINIKPKPADKSRQMKRDSSLSKLLFTLHRTALTQNDTFLFWISEQWTCPEEVDFALTRRSSPQGCLPEPHTYQTMIIALLFI